MLRNNGAVSKQATIGNPKNFLGHVKIVERESMEKLVPIQNGVNIG